MLLHLAHFARCNLICYQKEAKQYVPSDKDMPIIHMSQLIGLALGISPAELGMTKRHMTSTAALNRFVGA